MRTKKFKLLLAFVDIVVINVTLWFSFWLRFDGHIPDSFAKNWECFSLIITITRIAVFRLFSLYRSLWTYASTTELVKVFSGVTCSSVLIWLLSLLPFTKLNMPNSVAILSWLLCLFLVGGFRLCFRLLREYRSQGVHVDNQRVLIFGAGDAGSLVVREMKKENVNRWPVAFIDDDPKKKGMLIHGVPVVGSREDIKKTVSERNINEIVIAIPSAPRREIRAILNICQDAGVPVRILPGVYEIIDGKVSVSRIRDVSIEDLLGREPVCLNLQEIAGYLNGERVLVTGAGGSIGSELCRQIARFQPEELLLLGRGENSIYEIDQELSVTYPRLKKKAIIGDVKDWNRMVDIFHEFKPTVIFHAAAHKHVPLMENAPEEAVKNNIFGTRNVAELAHRFKCKRFVLISTDKAVNPTSIMGASKRMAEAVIQELSKKSKTKFCAVRFGNVLGSRGSVVPLFKRQIARGGPITITDPAMTRYFMTIPEAVSLVIQAGALVNKGEIFVLDMGEPVKITDLAEDLIKLSGYEPNVDIKIEYTGIRPGEKLYEELLTSEEGTKATKHERIFVAQPDDTSNIKVPSAMDAPPLYRVKKIMNDLEYLYSIPEDDEQLVLQSGKYSVI